MIRAESRKGAKRCPGPHFSVVPPRPVGLIASIVDNDEGVRPKVTPSIPVVPSTPVGPTVPEVPRRPVVVVGSRSLHHADAVQAHFEHQASIRFEDLNTPEEVGRATIDADAVVVASQLLDRAKIDALGQGVKVIARTGVGLDTVDLDSAAELGISVVNQPSYGAIEVASHAVGLALAVQRKFMVGDEYVRGGWNGTVALSPVKPLDEVCAGVVGCGRIGAVTAALLHHLVKEVRVYDPAAASVPDGVLRSATLDEVLAVSDILCLHVPLNDQTRGLIGRPELLRLPRGAVVVNVARGGVLDEDALLDLLEDGHLGGAGLDVFEAEPLPATSPLLSAPNTILTPHCASYSERSAWRLGTWSIGDALTWVTERRIVHGSLVIEGWR
jgi:D-3-phosphoglycerate dehydrogenase / 2-oxoglutarate reductase